MGPCVGLKGVRSGCHNIPSQSKNERSYPFKRQPHKMVKHTQTVCQQKLMNCLIVFDHIVGLAIKRLM